MYNFRTNKMKRILTKYIPLAFLLPVLLLSCNKFGDTNIDPTKSSNLDPINQLNFVEVRFGGDVDINERTSIILTMPMMQQIGGAYYTRYGSAYIESKQYMYDLWQLGYPTDVLNIVDAVSRTTGVANKTNLNAICRIMKVYIFARLTDLYGDIPYVDAGKGYLTGAVRPKYDKQKDIYTDFFKELKAAAAQLDASKDDITKDLLYGSKPDPIGSWKKFANSLRLRLAMRLVKIDDATAKAEAQDAFNSGLISSNAELCKLDYMNITNGYLDIRGNGVSVGINQYQDDGRPRVCTTLLTKMHDTNDPRLNYIARAYWVNPDKLSDRLDVTDQVKAKVGLLGVGPGKYTYDDFLGAIEIDYPGRGTLSVPNGGQKVQLADFLVRSDAPYFHMTYAEVEFLLAEANTRWGLSMGGTVKQHFEKGLEAACQQLALYPTGPTLTADEINKFKLDNQLAPGKELEQIDTQIWIALLMNGPEAYANWRRTGFPDLTPAPTTESTVKTIPRRFEYPLTEHEQNSVNIAPAIAALGGTDDWTGKVWWDK
ncbi:Starch-binding associating with outer membrane [Mucilaginibacter pineti]|uniref:Starch-binding associating with outer membrane n=2 Tax=Mucilaginibacter pineti TaxID=1391627 RepID=A0A1G7LRW4_9SPHI|nr:Starch-binding associating with outer membrane [Mucilaginibacter pineti]